MSNVVSFKIEQQGDGELRITDAELGRRLGYDDMRVFRRLIQKHEDNLAQLGDVFSKRIAPKGGGKSSKSYFLTEHQALFMISRSDMPAATSIMINVARAFIEMRRAMKAPSLTKELLALNILSPEVRVWERHFEKPFFDNLHRVLGLKKPGRNNHPNCGHFINRFVYGFLFGTLGLDVIRDANPKKVVRLRDDGTAEYVRAYRHHQMLKTEHEPVFQQHIRTLNTILGLSNGVQHFEDQFNAHFQQHETQIGFAFNEVRARLNAKEPANA